MKAILGPTGRTWSTLPAGKNHTKELVRMKGKPSHVCLPQSLGCFVRFESLICVDVGLFTSAEWQEAHGLDHLPCLVKSYVCALNFMGYIKIWVDRFHSHIF